MAQNYAAPAFVAVALLLFVAATPTAYGQLPVINSLNVVKINATLCCSSSGNCNGTAPPLSNVTVDLICNYLGVSVLVGQGVTNANGSVTFSVNYLLQGLGYTLNAVLTGKPLPCAAYVRLPLNQLTCPLLDTANGLIVGAVTLLNSVLEQMVYGTVMTFVNVNLTG